MPRVQQGILTDQTALGSDTVADTAGRDKLDYGQAVSGLGNTLSDQIDQMTPDGRGYFIAPFLG